MEERALPDTTGDIPQDTDVVFLSGNAFPFFGVPAMLGRTFLPSDAPANQAPQPVVVLTYRYWQRKFNGNPAIVGQNMRLDNRNYTILGVMPRNFTWWDPDIYMPLDTTDASVDSFMTVLRIKPGYTKEQVKEETQPIFKQMIREHPRWLIEGFVMDLVGVKERFQHSLGKTLSMLFAAVLLLLVIGCANVSILLLARGAARQHEFAIRAAVGASAKRIIRQLLTESLILGLAGVVLGVCVTYSVITPFAAAMLPRQLFPNGFYIPVQMPVLAFSIVLAVFASVLFGLFPALQLAKPEIRVVMQASSRKTAGSIYGRRLHSFLIASQIATAMVLLTAATSAIANFRMLLGADLGYDPVHVADLSIPIHAGSHTSQEARATYFRQLRDRVGQTPGVLSASLGLIAPPYSGWDFPVQILGSNAETSPKANVNFTDSAFFQVFHIPLMKGRLWDEGETSRAARLCIVNQAFVKRYFANGDPLGHSVRVPFLRNHPPISFAVDDSGGWTQIIGVVGDARNDGVDAPVKPEIYLPYSFYMIEVVQILIRTQGDPLLLDTAVRRQIANVSPGQQANSPTISMTKRVEDRPEWAHAHLIAVLSSVFSILSLLLASMGLYSVVSYSVSQRINEFGIRMALGAQRRHILLNVLATVGVSVASGLAVGLLLSFGLHRLLSHWVGDTVRNPVMVLAASLLVVLVALLACIVPAIRASMIRPMKALRIE